MPSQARDHLALQFVVGHSALEAALAMLPLPWS